MASLVPANFTDGVLTISDDNSNSATLLGSQGDFAISDLQASGREPEFYQSRGEFTGARRGAAVPVTFSGSMELRDAYGTFMVLGLGLTAGFTSTIASRGDVAGVDIDFSYDYGGTTRDFVLRDCHFVFSISEGSPSTISFSGTCIGNVEVDGNTVITRAAIA